MTGTAAVERTWTRRVRAEEPDLLEALLVAAGPHLVPVLDVGRAANGDLLLVLAEPAARLPDLLLGRAIGTPGEAVTVLAPLAGALARLHAAGVAVGADGAAVVLDPAGAPAWSPERAVLLRRVGPAAFSAAVDADLTGFAGLAEGLLARTGAPHPVAGKPLERVVDELFDLAEPMPVRLAPAFDPLPSGLPGRLLAPADLEPPAATGHRLPALVAPLRGVRRRVWVALGATATLLGAALLLLPAGGWAGAADASPVPAPTPSAVASSRPVAARAVAPERAVRLLLAARARCLAASDEGCLDAVEGAGSPLRQADRAALDAGTDPVLPGTADARLISDGGATAIAAVGRTVVVAMREEDGWRLRDVVAEPPG